MLSSTDKKKASLPLVLAVILATLLSACARVEVDTAAGQLPPTHRAAPAEVSELLNYSLPPTVTPVSGIIGSGIILEMHTPRQVAVENAWQGYLSNGELTLVYVGLLQSHSFSDDPTPAHVGAVYTKKRGGTVTNPLVTTEGLPSPYNQSGPLHIQRANSTTYLTLVSVRKGYKYRFYLSNQQLQVVQPTPTH